MEGEINKQHQGMFKRPFSFNGRIRRTEYCLTYIIYVIVAVILELLVDSGSTGVAELLIYVIAMIALS